MCPALERRICGGGDPPPMLPLSNFGCSCCGTRRALLEPAEPGEFWLRSWMARGGEAREKKLTSSSFLGDKPEDDAEFRILGATLRTTKTEAPTRRNAMTANKVGCNGHQLPTMFTTLPPNVEYLPRKMCKNPWRYRKVRWDHHNQ